MIKVQTITQYNIYYCGENEVGVMGYNMCDDIGFSREFSDGLSL
jgi:hypothetical protein